MIEQESIKKLKSFKNCRIAVVGDVMMDAYLVGKANRISPEAPVPVVEIDKRVNRLGGAANVALNLLALGAHPVICSVVGNDSRGEELIQLFDDSGIDRSALITSATKSTTVKTRIISNNQQIVRVDEEDLTDIDKHDEKALFEEIELLINAGKIKALIFEDYNKGVITKNLIKKVTDLCNKKGVFVTVDPKKNNFKAFSNSSLFKPNLKEMREGLGIDIDPSDIKSLNRAVEKLQKNMPHTISLITLSEYGVYINNKGVSQIIPAHKRTISDVSGAGDTVIAVATLCMALGIEANEMAYLANLAGGLVCEEPGVVPIDKKKLIAAI